MVYKYCLFVFLLQLACDSKTQVSNKNEANEYKYEKILSSAMDSIHRGNTFYAQKIVDSIYKIDSTIEDIWVVYAEIDRYKKNWDKAIIHISKAIYYNPNVSKFYVVKGDFFCEKGDFQSALIEMQNALDLSNSNPLYYSKFGTILDDIGEHTKAMKYHDTAVKLDSNNSVVLTNRATCYSWMKQYSNSLQDCNKSISIDSKNGQTYLIRANAYYYMGKLDLACSDYKSAKNNGFSINELDDLIKLSCK